MSVYVALPFPVSCTGFPAHPVTEWREGILSAFGRGEILSEPPPPRRQRPRMQSRSLGTTRRATEIITGGVSPSQMIKMGHCADFGE